MFRFREILPRPHSLTLCGVGDVFFLEESLDDVGLLLAAAEVRADLVDEFPWSGRASVGVRLDVVVQQFVEVNHTRT